GEEDRDGAQDEVPLQVGESPPVTAVLGEVDVGGVPGAELLGLLKEPHRDRVHPQAAGRRAGVGGPGRREVISSTIAGFLEAPRGRWPSSAGTRSPTTATTRRPRRRPRSPGSPSSGAGAG